jgi:putative endonuclease
MKETLHLGKSGESFVTEWLRKKNFSILQKNYRKRCGEIDIIAQKDRTLAFVEVKTRQKNYFPTSSVVTRSKQKKIIRTAKRFIVEQNLYGNNFRFDVAIVIKNSSTSTSLQYLPNAYTI